MINRCSRMRHSSWKYSIKFPRSHLTLFNIVEAPLKIVELWCLCCIMIFRWIRKQPGIQKCWHLCSHYKDICDWISSLNKRSGLPSILTQQSMGRNEYDESGHLSIFTLLRHLMMFLKCKFSWLHFFSCLCCIMIFRWIRKQPGIQKCWHLCSHYKDICDWISSLNKRSGLPSILTQQSMGRNEYDESGHLSIFTLLRHLMMFLKCKFSWLHFAPYQRHW